MTPKNILKPTEKRFLDFLNPKSSIICQDAGHSQRTEDQKHLVATISMQDCLDNLLNKLRFTRESDSATYSSLRGILKRYLEDHPNENCLSVFDECK